MNLSTQLSALCDFLRTQTTGNVLLGHPDAAKPALYIWPWKLTEQPMLRVPVRQHNGVISPQHPLLITHFLVVVLPTLSTDGLLRLEAARKAMLDHPILNYAGGSSAITMNAIPDETLASLFASLALPISLCLSATLMDQGQPTS